MSVSSRFTRTSEKIGKLFQELPGWLGFFIALLNQQNRKAVSELVINVLFPKLQKPSLQRLLTVSSVVIWVVKLSTSPQDECFKKA